MTPLTFGDIVVIGGGCYGSFYAVQLELARTRGRVDYRRLLVVDRDPDCRVFQDASAVNRVLVCQDWGEFLDDFLAGDPPDASLLVPSPLMPHLLFEWIERRAHQRWPAREIATRPTPAVGTPYDTPAPDGTRYVSYADWLCPTHCIEPAICPVTRGPRTWDMTEAAADLRRRNPALTAPVLFECRHVAFGVGAIGINQVLAGATAVIEAGSSGAAVNIPVATVSGCHGAFTILRLGAE